MVSIEPVWPVTPSDDQAMLEWQEFMIRTIAKAFEIPPHMLRDHVLGRKNIGGNSHQRRIRRRSLQILTRMRP